MFTDLLVPLDGSPVAAQAIPYVLALAGSVQARVTLLSVVERAENAVPSELDERDRTLAGTYLDSIAETMCRHGITTTTCVRTGSAAGVIVQMCEAGEHSLVVMATHGRSGVDRLLLGSVVQRVVRYAPIPTLVVRARAHGTTEGVAQISEVTATLDGSRIAEQALPAATALADALHVPLSLFEVLPNYYFAAYGWPGMAYAPTPEQDAADERAIVEYLDSVATRLRTPTREIRTTWQRSPTNRADEAIRTYLADKPTGIAVMASHGRGGIARWALGSTAESVIAHPPCAVLVVRANPTTGAEATPPVQ